MGLKQWDYRGRQKDGTAVKGTLTAYTRSEAERSLMLEGVTVLKLQELPQAPLEVQGTVRLTGEKLALLYRQISTMYNAGVPLDRAFNLLAEQAEPLPVRYHADDGSGLRRVKRSKSGRPEDRRSAEARVCLGVAQALHRGMTLAQAMQLFPNVFGPPHIAMLEVGTRGGIMPEVLNNLASLTEQADALQRKVRSATFYPVFVLVISIVAVFGLFNFIMPQFLALVKDLNVELPLVTRVLLFVAGIFRSPFIMLGLVAFIVFAPNLWKRAQKRRQIRLLLDTTATRAIFFGQVTHKVSLARAMQILAALTHAGLNLSESLPLTARACGNALIGDALVRVANRLMLGVTMTDAMRMEGRIFPSALLAYVETGEISGSLPEMLVRAGDMISMNALAALEVLPELLEPIIILLLGLVVGGIVLSVFVPLYSALKMM